MILLTIHLCEVVLLARYCTLLAKRKIKGTERLVNSYEEEDNMKMIARKSRILKGLSYEMDLYFEDMHGQF
jgi:hypothetical protein